MFKRKELQMKKILTTVLILILIFISENVYADETNSVNNNEIYK